MFPDSQGHGHPENQGLWTEDLAPGGAGGLTLTALRGVDGELGAPHEERDMCWANTHCSQFAKVLVTPKETCSLGKDAPAPGPSSQCSLCP